MAGGYSYYPLLSGGGGGGGVSSVGLALPSSVFTVTGSPVTASGTLTGSFKTQNANLVFAGPTTAGPSTPTMRLLVGADLPNPSASTLGGIQSKAAVTHQFLTSISTSGVPALAQPAFSDLSGSATGAQLPLPAIATLGGVFSKALVSHQFLTSISSVDGSVGQAQPAFSDISGTASLTSQVTGTLPIANGGTNSATGLNSNRFVISSSGAIVEAGAVTASRVVVSDSNGLPTASNITTTQINASLVGELSGMIETASVKTYFLDFKAAYGYTINTLDIATVSGTATVAVKINGTSVTGISAVSVSSSPATGTASAANTVAAGDQVTFVVTAASTPVDMAWTLKYTRT